MSRRRAGEGAKTVRCVEMLEALGIQVRYVIPARGYWSKKAEAPLWAFVGTFDGMVVNGTCWYSMTECVLAGSLMWDRRKCEVRPKEVEREK